MPATSPAPQIAADLVTAAELDHDHAGDLAAPEIAADLVTSRRLAAGVLLVELGDHHRRDRRHG